MIIEHDPALVEFHHTIDQGGDLVQPVAGYQHGHMRLPCSQQLKEGMPRLRVKVGRRLVEHQQVTVTTQCNADQQLLFLPAGEFVERLPADAVCIKAQLRRDREHHRGITVTDTGREANQLADRHFQWR